MKQIVVDWVELETLVLKSGYQISEPSNNFENGDAAVEGKLCYWRSHEYRTSFCLFSEICNKKCKIEDSRVSVLEKAFFVFAFAIASAKSNVSNYHK
ncbi:hypothetical protein H5410_035606 [Solanum commersonii]|uniref:Uncharacterized protein n=1 Tax=Solanum commersonii TaxID=4109 RepID=A0A9J5Y5N2_SOLCO|nr:hypothetical protein H5410_035606 [Solanum commersonii]